MVHFGVISCGAMKTQENIPKLKSSSKPKTQFAVQHVQLASLDFNLSEMTTNFNWSSTYRYGSNKSSGQMRLTAVWRRTQWRDRRVCHQMAFDIWALGRNWSRIGRNFKYAPHDTKNGYYYCYNFCYFVLRNGQQCPSWRKGEGRKVTLTAAGNNRPCFSLSFFSTAFLGGSKS